MLVEKWQMELRTRFGTQAEVVRADDLLERLSRGAAANQDAQAFICSLQGLRPATRWDDEDEPSQTGTAKLARFLAEAAEAGDERLFDLTIIDEAHYLRNPETSSAALGELLRPVSEHFVLLTATPINTQSRDLFTLLKLVDPDHFRFEDEFNFVLRANEPLVRAAALLRQEGCTGAVIREQLLMAQKFPVLRNLKQLQLLLDDLALPASTGWLSPEERVSLSQRIDGVNLLSKVLTRTRKSEIFENSIVRDARRRPATMTETERVFYERVTAAIHHYATTRDNPIGFLLATPQRQMSSCMAAAARRWLKRVAVESDDAEFAYEAFGVDDIDYGSVSPLIDHIAVRIQDIDVDALVRQDSKYSELSRILGSYFGDYPDEKVIVFSYFRDTLAYLRDRLADDGITSVVLQGGDDKQQIIDQFKADPSIRVLLSSEVAAEGVDLQFMRMLVNYDLPWNPMKVEQRIGRIDRIGQKAELITIFNLVYADTIDDRILDRLYGRLELFRNSLGATDDVVGQEFADLTRDLLSGRLSAEEQERRVQRSADAILRRQDLLRKVEEHESDLLGLGDLIRQRIRDARDHGGRVSDQDLFDYIRIYLDEHAPGHLLRADPATTGRYRLKLPPATAAAFGYFIDQRRLARSQLLGENEIGVRIENHVGGPKSGRDELINQFHPIISFISEQHDRSEDAAPAVAIEVSAADLGETLRPGIYTFSASTWTFSGLRMEEFVRAAFVELGGAVAVEDSKASELLQALRRCGRDWLDYLQMIDGNTAASDGLEQAERLLTQSFRSTKQQRQAENHDRVQLQLESIDRHFDRRDAELAQRIQLVRLTPGRTTKMNVARYEKQREKLRTTAELQRAKVKLSSGLKAEKARCVSGLLRVTR